jgi:hypothetical protein
MAADYDGFSRQFKKSRRFPFRTCIEVLGYYARLLRRHRAARVIAVGISVGMIALAREEEAREPWA